MYVHMTSIYAPQVPVRALHRGVLLRRTISSQLDAANDTVAPRNQIGRQRSDDQVTIIRKKAQSKNGSKHTRSSSAPVAPDSTQCEWNSDDQWAALCARSDIEDMMARTENDDYESYMKSRGLSCSLHPKQFRDVLRSFTYAIPSPAQSSLGSACSSLASSYEERGPALLAQRIVALPSPLRTMCLYDASENPQRASSPFHPTRFLLRISADSVKDDALPFEIAFAENAPDFDEIVLTMHQSDCKNGNLYEAPFFT